MDTNEAPANVMNAMSEATEAAAGMLPLDMVNAIAELADPAAVAKEMPWLAEELTKIALGKSDVAFDKRDKRFADEAWQNVPYFKLLGQSYRLFEMWMDKMYEHADGTWQDKARARFAADVITAAVAPTNYLGTNPEAMKKAMRDRRPVADARRPEHAERHGQGRDALDDRPQAVHRRQGHRARPRVPWCTGTRCSSCCSTSPPRPRCAPFRC